MARKAGDDRQRVVGDETTGQPKLPDKEGIYRAQVLLGTTLGVFWHEFGHALIGETRVPATGPEEDVADGFAAFVLSAAVDRPGATPEEQDFMAGTVKYASLLWYYAAEERQISGQELSWQNEHARDLKRFRNAFCIIYGSNPKRFEGLARQVGISDRTRQRCRAEQKKRHRAWETILKTVSRDLGPGLGGAYPANTPGGRILLDFAPTRSPTGRSVVRLLNASGIMEHMMQDMERLYVWPRDLKIFFRDCPRPNAWYDGDIGSITVCYGLIEILSELIYRAEGRAWEG
ncbi:MAG: DUF4344 domain-containing metallopeptidase [Pseudomonadota bacterium]